MERVEIRKMGMRLMKKTKIFVKNLLQTVRESERAVCALWTSGRVERWYVAELALCHLSVSLIWPLQLERGKKRRWKEKRRCSQKETRGIRWGRKAMKMKRTKTKMKKMRSRKRKKRKRCQKEEKEEIPCQLELMKMKKTKTRMNKGKEA